jgi:hypothetical protein
MYNLQATAKVECVALVILSFISVAASGECGQARTNLSQEPRTQTLAKHQSARAKDCETLGEFAVSPADSADLLSQAAGADRSEGELRNVSEISPEEIADAPEGSQSKISSEQRSLLIERLNKAERADEYRMNSVNGDSYGHDLLRAQADLAGRTIDELKAGKNVPWSQINQALEAPKDR